MAFDRTQTIIPFGKRIAYSDTSGGSYTSVFGTIEVDLPDRDLGKAEITNDDSTLRHKDYIPGLYEPGTIKVTYRYTRTQFAALETIFQLATVQSTVASATKYWKTTLPDGSTALVQGFIVKHSLPMDLESSPAVELEIQCLGAMTWTSGS